MILRKISYGWYRVGIYTLAMNSVPCVYQMCISRHWQLVTLQCDYHHRLSERPALVGLPWMVHHGSCIYYVCTIHMQRHTHGHAHVHRDMHAYTQHTYSAHIILYRYRHTDMQTDTSTHHGLVWPWPHMQSHNL